MEHLTPSNHLQAEMRADELSRQRLFVKEIKHDGASGYYLLFDSDIVPPTAAEILASVKISAVREIDTDAGNIYTAVLGGKESEYMAAEAAANAYKTAGYSGVVPADVQSWATAKGQAAQWAADDILATANAWRGAQSQIREARLAKKESIRTSADSAAVATHLAAWKVSATAIRASLGI